MTTEHDKLVEDCARGIAACDSSECDWELYVAEARAALAIAVERCAAVADNFSSEGDMAEHLAKIGIAAAIRALAAAPTAGETT